jgi:FeS assembly SUF system protein
MPTLTPQERNAIEVEIVDTLCTVYDPEIPVNIYELGLIYDILVGKEGEVKVEMTLTSPGCPVAGTLPGEVEAKVRTVEGVNNVTVELVWEPAWSMDRMSDEAKLELGML